jgi:hypothetical protein
MLTKPGFEWLGSFLGSKPLHIALINSIEDAPQMARLAVLEAEVSTQRIAASDLQSFVNGRLEWATTGTYTSLSNINVNKLALIADGNGIGLIEFSSPASATSFTTASAIAGLAIGDTAVLNSTEVTITGIAGSTYSYASTPAVAGATKAIRSNGIVLGCIALVAPSTMLAGNSYSVVYSTASYNA